MTQPLQAPMLPQQLFPLCKSFFKYGVNIQCMVSDSTGTLFHEEVQNIAFPPKPRQREQVLREKSLAYLKIMRKMSPRVPLKRRYLYCLSPDLATLPKKETDDYKWLRDIVRTFPNKKVTLGILRFYDDSCAVSVAEFAFEDLVDATVFKLTY